MRVWPLALLCLCACDDSPQQVNRMVGDLTPLPRIPSDLALQLKSLKKIVDAAGESSDSKHIVLGRQTISTAFTEGYLAARVEGRSVAALKALFPDDRGAIPGAKTLAKWLTDDHELSPLLKAAAQVPGRERQERLGALSQTEGLSGQGARLLLSLAFKELLDGDTTDVASVARAYPYACPRTMQMLARSEIPKAEDMEPGCPVACPAFKHDASGKTDARTRRLALRKACSAKSLGLRAPEEYRYAGPQLAPLRFALVHGENTLRLARKDGGPLGDRARRFLSALQGQASDRAVPGAFPGWFGPGEFRHGVIMRFSAPLKGAEIPKGRRFATIDKYGNVRVGLQPMLSVADQGVRFLDLESELAWPGRLVRRKPDPMFPAPSGDPLGDAIAGLSLRAQGFAPDAGSRPLMLVLSRGAPAKALGRVLSYLPRGSSIELAYWAGTVRAVTAHVGWTRTRKKVVADQRTLDREMDIGAEGLSPRVRRVDPTKPPQGDGGPRPDTGAPGLIDRPAADGGKMIQKPDTGPSTQAGSNALTGDGELSFDAGQLQLGATGKIRLARSGKKTQVTISGKEVLFTDLAGDARLQLAGYHSSRKGPRMEAWRKRLATLAATLPEDARVLLHVRRDAPTDAVVELVGALSPRPVDLSLPHDKTTLLKKGLYED